MSHTDTLLALSHPLVALLIAALLGGAWRFMGRPAHLLYFIGAFASYATALILQITLWPANLTVNIAATGVLYGAGAFLFAGGIAQLERQRLPSWPSALILAAMLAVRLWSIRDPAWSGLRIGALYTAVTLLFLLALWRIRHLARGTALERLLFGFLLLGILSLLPRVLLTMNAKTLDYGYDGGMYWVLTQLSFYLFSVGAAVLLVLLTAFRTIAHFSLVSERDALTGLRNRNSLLDFLARSRGTAERYGLVILDADHFKQINDHYGHPVGDAVLQAMAGVLAQHVRKMDALGRIGGEEFMLVLPGATLEETEQAAVRLQAALAQHDFSSIVPGLRCTASFGIGSFEGDVPFEASYAHVDRLLALAKRQGRNRIGKDATQPAEAVVTQAMPPLAAFTGEDSFSTMNQ
ncbi:GGDEF domain-containing protein [Pigmentiphaga sp. GD03639]|uniref:diguanylate cyclase n=1 Tax=Pigmentiphaga daeguensis TaxID=414049 RepID=A0ABN1BUB0_9BURK|nr:GGDEF domain-containing protein [Pigmentiphaga sp. GD03639]MDH2240128.1 GGDEF domain-containing protein [Pigmentiphaga sp. GD03639]